MVVEKKSNSILKYRKVSERNYLYSINRVEVKRNRKGYSEKAAQQRAMYLADKFHNPQGIRFYLKCAWNLTDSYIDWLVEYSFKKSNPKHYFVSVASKKMAG
jgi:hypothetical protein